MNILHRELIVDNKTREAAAITAAAEKPVKQVETLSMQVSLLHKLHLPVIVPLPLTNPSPSLPLSIPCLMRSLVFVWGLYMIIGLSVYRWPYLGWSRSIYHVFRHNSRMGHWPWLICLWREGPLIFASLLDEFRCGHFAIMWSFFIVIQRGLINWIVIFCHHTCHSSFLCKLAVTDLLPAIDTKTRTSVYISFPFIMLTDRFLNWVYQNIRTVRNHPSKSVSLPSMDVIR